VKAIGRPLLVAVEVGQLRDGLGTLLLVGGII
jgi:hypothetical protein